MSEPDRITQDDSRSAYMNARTCVCGADANEHLCPTDWSPVRTGFDPDWEAMRLRYFDPATSPDAAWLIRRVEIAADAVMGPMYSVTDPEKRTLEQVAFLRGAEALLDGVKTIVQLATVFATSPPEPQTCRWTETGDGTWETACGRTLLLSGRWEYDACPYCGGELKGEE